MDTMNALYLTSCLSCPKNGLIKASKDNPYIGIIDGVKFDATHMRLMSIAYQTIADHLDDLNKDLK